MVAWEHNALLPARLLIRSEKSVARMCQDALPSFPRPLLRVRAQEVFEAA